MISADNKHPPMQHIPPGKKSASVVLLGKECFGRPELWGFASNSLYNNVVFPVRNVFLADRSSHIHPVVG